MEPVSQNQLIQIIRSAQYIIADRYLISLYPKMQGELAEKVVFYVDSPEKSKSIEVYAEAIDYLLEGGITRSDKIVVIGGGATSDLGGFVASTVLRGVPWSVIPTTLLAMVDASIGGKVGINSKAGKNLIGQFHNPSDIFYHHDFLTTLSKEEFNSGFGEIIKYSFLEKPIYTMLINGEELSTIIRACAKFKQEIVISDFKEKGARKILNLGHTFGHAFEKTLSIPHGEAVMMGLHLIISIYAPQLIENFNKVLESQEIAFTPRKCDYKKFSQYLKKDKKVLQHQKIELIIPKDIGRVEIERKNIDEVLSEVDSHESFQTYFC